MPIWALYLITMALLLSTVLEGYRWTPLAGLGLVLVLSGNLILLLKRKPQSDPEAPLPAPQFQKGPTG